ncbi:MAG TPA: DUF4133 domain-containing protein [Mucilaginibacter sp.]|nr:DUF4133 domain-containing protein [Mucilaginibacter sp.]
MSSVYQINKGVGRPMEFRGLRAQYIVYLAGGLFALLTGFFLLYLCGVNTYICLVLVLGCGTALIWGVYRLNAKYGRYGLMKKRAKRRLPDYLFFNSRKLCR